MVFDRVKNFHAQPLKLFNCDKCLHNIFFIMLLEAVHRTQEFSRLPDDELAAIAQKFGLTLKKNTGTFATWREFDTWYHDVTPPEFRYESAPIEGFVLRDAAGWHVKAKLPYYIFWKQIRSQPHRLATGKHYSINEYAIEPERMREILDPLVSLSPDELPSLFELHKRHLRL